LGISDRERTTGGRKKKLKRRLERIEAIEASRNPQVLAMSRTNSRYANPTVVALTGITPCAINVITVTPPKDTNNRNER
jgi:hypothetical protein